MSKEESMDDLIFQGTESDTVRLCEILAPKYGEKKEFLYILVRYLGLPIPDQLEEEYWMMSDEVYARTLTEVKQAIVEARHLLE